jgi:hypothetical protein
MAPGDYWNGSKQIRLLKKKSLQSEFPQPIGAHSGSWRAFADTPVDIVVIFTND